MSLAVFMVLTQLEGFARFVTFLVLLASAQPKIVSHALLAKFSIKVDAGLNAQLSLSKKLAKVHHVLIHVLTLSTKFLRQSVLLALLSAQPAQETLEIVLHVSMDQFLSMDLALLCVDKTNSVSEDSVSPALLVAMDAEITLKTVSPVLKGT